MDKDTYAYRVCGNGESIVLLHGWLQTKEVFDHLISHLEQHFTVYSLDLLGFGKSSMPKEGLSIKDYAEKLHHFFKEHNLDDAILLGHSFGGRIAIKYSSMYHVKKLILIGSAGIKQKRSLYVLSKIWLYKFFKIFKIKLQVGSNDYKNLNKVMQHTMSLALKEDQRIDMKKITAPTLIVWGSDDDVTKLKDAKKIQSTIKGSGLVVIPNTGHFCFLEDSLYFNIILDAFLLGELDE